MLVSYRLSIVTIALCLTIRPQFAVDCLDAQINREWVTLGQNFGRKELTNVSQSLTIVERHVIVAAVCKGNRVNILCCLSTINELTIIER